MSISSRLLSLTPLVIDVPTAASLLGVAPVTIRRLLRAGVLPTVRVGAAVRIPIAAVRTLASAPVTFDDSADAASDGDSEVPLRRSS